MPLNAVAQPKAEVDSEFEENPNKIKEETKTELNALTQYQRIRMAVAHRATVLEYDLTDSIMTHLLRQFLI